jgi:branched-chain amino acid transport system substrate-binding protein
VGGGEHVSVTYTDGQLAAVEAQEIVGVLHAGSVVLVEDPSSPAAAVDGDLEMLLRRAGVRVDAPVPLAQSGDPSATLSSAAARHADVVVVAAAPDRDGALTAAAAHAGLGGRCLVVEIGPAAQSVDPGPGTGRCLAGGVPPLASLPGGTRYSAAYTARYHLSPGPWGAFAHDAVTAVVDALRRAGAADPRRLGTALGVTTGVAGATGDLTIEPTTGDRRVPPLAVLDLDAGRGSRVDRAWADFAGWPAASAK